MSRWLVEQQQIGRHPQRLRQQHTPLHAARQRREVGLVGQPEAFHRLRGACLQRPSVGGVDRFVQLRHPLGVELGGVAQVVVFGDQLPGVTGTQRDHIEHRAGKVARHFLRHPRDAQPFVAGDTSIVRRNLAGDQLEQRRLALAIAPDHANALAGIDGEIGIFDQQRSADGVVDVVQGQEGHCFSVSSEWE